MWLTASDCVWSDGYGQPLRVPHSFDSTAGVSNPASPKTPSFQLAEAGQKSGVHKPEFRTTLLGRIVLASLPTIRATRRAAVMPHIRDVFHSHTGVQIRSDTDIERATTEFLHATRESKELSRNHEAALRQRTRALERTRLAQSQEELARSRETLARSQRTASYWKRRRLTSRNRWQLSIYNLNRVNRGYSKSGSLAEAWATDESEFVTCVNACRGLNTFAAQYGGRRTYTVGFQPSLRSSFGSGYDPTLGP